MARSSGVRVSCLDCDFLRSRPDCRRGSSSCKSLSRLIRFVACTGLAFLSEGFPDEAPRLVMASLMPSCSKRTRFLAIFASRSSSLSNNNLVCTQPISEKHVLLRFKWHDMEGKIKGVLNVSKLDLEAWFQG